MSNKMMCIDDSPTIRNLIKDSLIPEGWEIIESENGQDALDKLTNDITIFVVDVHMPIMDGFEFVTHLKKREPYTNIPIVFLTTKISDDMKIKGTISGIKGWIVKPFNRDTLLTIIDRVVN
ncbi:MAG: response regulator [Spirochaetaceae bacterium]